MIEKTKIVIRLCFNFFQNGKSDLEEIKRLEQILKKTN